MLKNKYAFIVL